MVICSREEAKPSTYSLTVKDNRSQAEALAWLHLLPVLNSEQAVSLQEGQEIVGTRRISAATSRGKLLPENNVTNSARSRGGVKKPKRKLENNEEVDVTPLLL